MSNVTDWDPVDEANTNAPPNGWPEFMQPSAVNNTGRMMMGAVRRMYDGQMSGAIALPYLPLATGGTVHGAVFVDAVLTGATVNSNGSMHATANISADGAITGGSLGASGAVTGASITATGAINGASIAATGNVTASGTITGNAVVSNGNVNAGAYQIQGSQLATRSGSEVALYDNAGQFTLRLHSDGNNYYANTTHRFVNRGATVGFVVIDGGGLAVNAGHINLNNGGSLTVTGNVNCPNQYSGGSMNLSGEVRGGSLAANGAASIGGSMSVASVLTAHDIMPSVDNVSICGGAASAWQVVESYSYVTKSDAALKQDIGPLPDTLPLVAAVTPQAFQYQGDGRRHWGFIAQDVQAAVGDCPVDLVSGEEGRLGLDYGGLTAMLWKAVQELSARLAALEGR